MRIMTNKKDQKRDQAVQKDIDLLKRIVVETNIIRVPASKIQPYAQNAKRHTEKQVSAVARSIQRFGFNVPILVDAKNVIIAGHCRYEAAKSLGMDEVPCIPKTKMSAADVRAYRLIDNKLNESMWLADVLTLEVKEMGEEGQEILRIAYDEQELREINGDIAKAGLTDDDEVPEPPKKAKTVHGDIYQLGDHRLMCGDSLMNSELNTLMGKDKADLVFTDPPYNVDYEGYTKEKLKIQNDKMSDKEFQQFLNDTFVSYRCAIKDGASLYVCHPSSYQREFQTAMEQAGFAMRCQIIWAKNTFGWGFGRYKFQHEPIFYAFVKGESDPWYGDKSQSTLWQENKPNANRLHPTMKPVELVMRAITNSSKTGDVVLDLFGGSGSTLIAAEKLRRRCFTMELDPRYCDVIVKRWEDFTGQKAVRTPAETQKGKKETCTGSK